MIIQTDSRQLGVAVVGAGDGVVLARVEVTLNPRQKENIKYSEVGVAPKGDSQDHTQPHCNSRVLDGLKIGAFTCSVQSWSTH